MAGLDDTPGIDDEQRKAAQRQAAERQAKAAERQLQVQKRRRKTLQALAAPLVVGVAIIISYGAATSGTIGVVAGAVGAAALAAGALLGFLFGIPRALTSESAPIVAPEEVDPADPRYQPNTNLEQVSDWLTKVLIGVGLAQARDIVKGFKEITLALKPALGNDETARVFGGAEIVYFVIAGFLCTYLYTRLRLQQDLEDAAQRMRVGGAV